MTKLSTKASRAKWAAYIRGRYRQEQAQKRLKILIKNTEHAILDLIGAMKDGIQRELNYVRLGKQAPRKTG
jgi:hypothetical protein